MRYVYVVEGNIACGKTTLLNGLERYGYTVLREPVDEWRTRYVDPTSGENLLALFYSDKPKWGFRMQMMALVSRCTALIRALEQPSQAVLIVERSLWTDMNVFAASLRDKLLLEGVDWEIFSQTAQLFADIVLKKASIAHIYVCTSATECHARVKSRNAAEESNVTVQYLEDLEKLHTNWLAPSTPRDGIDVPPVFQVDGNQSATDVLSDVIDIIQ